MPTQEPRYTRERVESLVMNAVLRGGGEFLCISRFAPGPLTPDQSGDIAWALNEMLEEGLLVEAPKDRLPVGTRNTYYHATDLLFGEGPSVSA